MQLQRVHLLAVLRRLAGAFALLWLVLTLTFALVRLAPADAARIRAELGLDRSVAVQYARWANGVLHGNLGESSLRREPVTRAIADALPVSLGLGAASLALTFLIGVPLGLVQAARRGRFVDRALTLVTTAVYAAPSFW